MTENSIANSALAYLARFSSSSANLRQVLTRKVMRATAHHGDDPTPLLAKIETVIARYLESGILNDALYAETQVRNLRRRGGSTRIIAQRLAAKGIDSDLVSETLAESATDNRAAAIASRGADGWARFAAATAPNSANATSPRWAAPASSIRWRQASSMRRMWKRWTT